MTRTFVGIDLGTTNSVIAWGQVTDVKQVVVPKEIELSMKSRDGGLTRRKTLPSFLFMQDPDNPVVGEYAKALVGISPHVVRSVKSRMGSDHRYRFGEMEFSPAELSARILQHLASEGKRHLGFRPEVLVITVPASFDSDMRQATLEAARIADFVVSEGDARPGVVLLDEPRAALYDFMNRQSRGEIPATLIDFTRPRTVLVFDLGGGTLDVSLHRVNALSGPGEMLIDDLAISRYTRLGGDDFDFALAQDLLREFLGRYDFGTIEPQEQAMLENTFMAIAEEAKIELTTEISNSLTINGRDPTEIEIQISKVRVFRDRSFESELTLARYRDAVAPLLAHHLDLGDLDRIDMLTDTDNLIFPILDVLRKATAKIDTVPKVDAVLLNGGMTKVHAIQQRLEDLFGFPPLTVGDPDHSVARGAVVYHQMLSQGKRASRILNESVGIGIHGGFVRHLASAGTVLPHISEVFTDFTVPVDGAGRIDIPFYVGEGKRATAPNRRIATRTLKFPTPLREGDGISLRVRVDESNLMTVEAWLTARPDVKFEVSVATNQVETSAPASQSSRGSATPKSAPLPPRTPDRQDVQGDGDEMELRKTVEELRGYLKRCRPGALSTDRVLHASLLGLESNITKAENASVFIDPLVDLIGRDFPHEGTGRLVLLVGNLVARNPSHAAGQASFLKAVKRLLDLTVWRTETTHIQKQRMNGFGRFAIEALGKTHDPEVAPFILELLAAPEFAGARANLLFALGKTGRSVECLKAVVPFLRSNQTSDRIASAWALGKLGMRERADALPIEEIVAGVRVTIAQCRIERHLDARRNQVYALAELGDRRGSEPYLPDALDADYKKLLIEIAGHVSKNRSLIGMDPIVRMATIARIMNEGSLLAANEMSVLLTLRTQLAQS